MDRATELVLWDYAALSVYFLVVLLIGLWFAKFTSTTADFFFAGRRFHWWVLAMSCVATLVGSYSFVQYSEVGFKYGFCAMTPYTNEWFVLPLFLFGWFPLVYYHRLTSVPEYFERRFNPQVRFVVTVILLIYLQGYIAVNLLTIGRIMKGALGIDVMVGAALMAVISGIYLHAGGQTSVLATDVFQGLLLLFAGLYVFVMGIAEIGGVAEFWSALPEHHRYPFARFNEPPYLHAVGNFWNDAMTATFAFYFINQGVLMRFLSARSVREGRKAMFFVVVCLMPVAAVAVSGAGWVGRAMHELGLLPENLEARDIFVAVTGKVAAPGVQGLILAAVVAALMSTLDTLITAVAAVGVNDVWRVIVPNRSDHHYLAVARAIAIVSAILGILFIPIFQEYDTIYQALSDFLSTVGPPLAVPLALALLWPRFHSRAAVVAMLGGMAAMILALKYPVLVTPFGHGVDPSQGYSHLRSLYGLVVTGTIAILATFLIRKGDSNPTSYTWHTLPRPRFIPHHRKLRLLHRRFHIEPVEDDRVLIWLHPSTAGELELEPGERLYVCDARWWLGGLRSVSVILGGVREDLPKDRVALSTAAIRQGYLLPDRKVILEFEEEPLAEQPSTPPSPTAQDAKNPS